MATKRKKLSLESMAINGGSKSAPHSANEKLVKLKLDQLVENSFNPRTFYIPSKIQERAESLKNQGQLSPIIVVQGEAPGQYMVIDGHYRWKGAKEAGWTEIEAIIRYDLTERDYFLIGRVANDAHETNSIFDVAKGVQKLKDKGLGKSNAELIELTGESSESSVSKLLKIAEIPFISAEVMAARTPKVEMTVAYEAYLLWGVIQTKFKLLDDALQAYHDYCLNEICKKNASRPKIEAYRKSLMKDSTRKKERPPFTEFYDDNNNKLGSINLSGKKVNLSFKATNKEKAQEIAEKINELIKDNQ